MEMLPKLLTAMSETRSCRDDAQYQVKLPMAELKRQVDPESLVMFLCRSGARSDGAATLAAATPVNPTIGETARASRRGGPGARRPRRASTPRRCWRAWAMARWGRRRWPPPARPARRCSTGGRPTAPAPGSRAWVASSTTCPPCPRLVWRQACWQRFWSLWLRSARAL